MLLVEVAQNRLWNVITAKKLVVDKYYGCLPEHKEMRDKLFSVSNKRGILTITLMQDRKFKSFTSLFKFLKHIDKL